MNTILKLLTSVGGVISSFFTWKNSAVSQRRETEQDIEKKEAEKSSLKAEIKHAVYNEDDNKLNEIVSRIMMLFFIAFATVIFTACTSNNTVLYIPTDRRIESCTNSIGISCKAVPNAVFVEMLEAQIELKALQREMKVEKQLSK